MIGRHFRRVYCLFVRLRGNRKGATAVEYGLIVALIVIAVIGGLNSLGGSTGGAWNGVAEKVKAATPN